MAGWIRDAGIAPYPAIVCLLLSVAFGCLLPWFEFGGWRHQAVGTRRCSRAAVFMDVIHHAGCQLAASGNQVTQSQSPEGPRLHAPGKPKRRDGARGNRRIKPVAMRIVACVRTYSLFVGCGKDRTISSRDSSHQCVNPMPECVTDLC